MISLIKKLFKNQAVRYIFFGGCTTMVNLVSYALLRYVCGIDITVANLISIFLSILFAYVVNKIFVFESVTHGIRALIVEASQFIGMRLTTMFIETFGVTFMSCVWGIQDMIAKLIIRDDPMPRTHIVVDAENGELTLHTVLPAEMVNTK